ncbi:MAG: hypothetical protein ABMA26_03405 [Limisphaerales bacterium]
MNATNPLLQHPAHIVPAWHLRNRDHERRHFLETWDVEDDDFIGAALGHIHSAVSALDNILKGKICQRLRRTDSEHLTAVLAIMPTTDLIECLGSLVGRRLRDPDERAEFAEVLAYARWVVSERDLILKRFALSPATARLCVLGDLATETMNAAQFLEDALEPDDGEPASTEADHAAPVDASACLAPA